MSLTAFRDTRDEPDRDRPSTLPYCSHCEDHVLRSEWPEHEQHDRAALGLGRYNREHRPGEKDEEEERQIGSMYSVRIEKTVTWQFDIPAVSENDAKSKASDMVEYGNAVDAHTVHTDVSETEPIYESEEDEYFDT